MNTARPPRGLLSKWAWAAIARLHAAGDGGLVLDFDGNRAVPWWERAPAWNMIVRLRNRKSRTYRDSRSTASRASG